MRYLIFLIALVPVAALAEVTKGSSLGVCPATSTVHGGCWISKESGDMYDRIKWNCKLKRGNSTRDEHDDTQMINTAWEGTYSVPVSATVQYYEYWCTENRSYMRLGSSGQPNIGGSHKTTCAFLEPPPGGGGGPVQ